MIDCVSQLLNSSAGALNRNPSRESSIHTPWRKSVHAAVRVRFDMEECVDGDNWRSISGTMLMTVTTETQSPSVNSVQWQSDDTRSIEGLRMLLAVHEPRAVCGAQRSGRAVRALLKYISNTCHQKVYACSLYSTPTSMVRPQFPAKGVPRLAFTW